MIVFCSAEGTVTKVLPSPVYQGSSLSGGLYFVAPFPSSNTVTVAFQLANGDFTTDYLLSPITENDNELQDVFDKLGKNYSVWEWQADNGFVTAYAGEVTAQFKVVYAKNGVAQLQTTASVVFTVQKGVEALPAAPPSDKQWNDLLALYTQLAADYTQLTEGLPNDYLTNTKEDQIALKNNSAVEYSAGPAPDTIVKRDGAGNINVYDGTEDLNAVNVRQLNAAKYSDITNIDLNTGDTTVEYDTELGITVNAKGTVTHENGATEQPTTKFELPIIAGEGVSIDKKENEEKVEIKVEQSALEKIYGVDGVGAQNPSSLTRTDEAVGLTYTVGTSEITSDFDNCYPWSDIKEVTDSYGNVFIRIPKFYCKVTKNADGTYKYQISGTKYKGFSTLFVDGKGNEIDYILIGKYEASGDSTRAYSKSGKPVLVNRTRAQFRTACKANGAGYQQYDFLIDTIIKELWLVEMKTTNSQSVMAGYTNANTAALQTGTTDTVLTPSGSPESNTDGKHACKYRGIENPFGNVWKWCDGINFDTEKIYVCEDPEYYADDKYDAPYTYMGSRVIKGGYIKTVTPFAKQMLLGFVNEVGADAATYYCDYTWHNDGVGTVLRCGGGWGDNVLAGNWYWGGGSTASDTGSALGGRLCYKPISSTKGGIPVTPSGATVTATNGTFTSDEWVTLQASDNNYILFKNEIYRLAVKGHAGTEGIWSYTHIGWDGTAIMDKSINVTVSTGAWTLVVGQESGGVKLYRHNISLVGNDINGPAYLYLLSTVNFQLTTNVAIINNLSKCIVLSCSNYTDIPNNQKEYMITQIGQLQGKLIITLFDGAYSQINGITLTDSTVDTITEI